MEDKVKDLGFTAFGNFPLLFCKCSNKIYSDKYLFQWYNSIVNSNKIRLWEKLKVKLNKIYLLY